MKNSTDVLRRLTPDAKPQDAPPNDPDLLSAIAELDPSRPAMLLAIPKPAPQSLDPAELADVFGIVPCQNIRAETDDPSPAVRINGNTYRVGEPGAERYIGIEGDLAVISSSEALLSSLRSASNELIASPGSFGNTVLILHWDAAPKILRQQIQETARQVFQQSRPQNERDVLVLQMAFNTVMFILQDCDTLRFELGVDPGDNSLRYDIRLDARTDSELSKSLRSMSRGGSRYRNLLDPEADLNLSMALQLPPIMRRVAGMLNPHYVAPDVLRAMQDSNRFSAVQASYEEAASAGDIVRRTSVELGRLDFACSIQKLGKPVQGWGAVFAAGAENIEQPLAEFLTAFRQLEPESSLIPAVSQHADTPVHALDRSFSCALGKNTVHFAFGPQDERLIERTFVEESEGAASAPDVSIEGRTAVMIALLPLERLHPVGAEYLRRNPVDGRFRISLDLEPDAALLSFHADSLTLASIIEGIFKPAR